ncbi:hypothetical protein JEU11_03740 [Paraglaciecola chathamensis]|uniref:Uncharacterized protein n=1 Tax=Paraglaciecola chathamensis TaxID=368405 RepID=A0ABS0WAS2_9ALTE|nr:hypothetical protein [Paraglaciecola chathamensis]MBJ2135556.1 hypothetical protein [Paraglaciecola chathamensis]
MELKSGKNNSGTAIKDKEIDFDLDNYQPSADVVSFQHSNTEALIDVGDNKTVTITVPKNSTLTLHLILIAFLNSVKFKALAPSSRKARYNIFRQFLSFIEKQEYRVDKDVPNEILGAYLQYMIKNSKQKAKTLKGVINGIKNTLQWYLDQPRNFPHIGNKRKLINIYLAFSIRINAEPSEKRPSLSALFPDCPYSDTELIKSLRLTCCWLLLEYNRQREILLNNEDVCINADKLKQRELLEVPVSKGVLNKRKEHGDRKIVDECRTLYFPILRTITQSEDLVIQERFIQCMRHPFGTTPSENELKLILEAFAGQDGKVKGIAKLQGKNYKQPHITSFTYIDILCPSVVEVFAAQCFLASDRIQTSNLQRLKLDDFAENKRGIQGQHIKGRRPKKHQVGATDVYPPNQLIFDALHDYLHLLEGCQSILPEEFKSKALPYLCGEFMLHGNLGQADNELSNCFTLLTTKGSHIQQAIFKDISEDEAKPFLWVVKKLINNNKACSKQTSEYSKYLYDKTKNKRDLSRSDFVDISTIGLSVSAISESRIAMESGNPVSVKGVGTPEEKEDGKVAAQLTGQTEATKHNTYFDRTNAKESVKSNRKFAVQVGELMLEDAKKMGVLMENTDVIDFEQAKRVLGCSSDTDDLKSLLDELDKDVGLTGEIKQNEKTIFIATDLTAALIIRQIEHIDQQLPRLFIDDPEIQNKATAASSMRVYLQEVFKRFPEHIQKKGNALAPTLTFSFADLV